MGCGASVQKTAVPVEAAAPQPETKPPETPVLTWATKTEARKVSIPSDRSAVASKGPWASTRGQNNLTMTDADDESSEIEIIFEGKAMMTPRQIMAANCANGQEAPEIAEVEAPEPVLSKRQQEEAAKLAEQRKRFDNQRYQRELAGGISPTFQTPPPGVTPVKAQLEAPRHELVVGLNLTEAPSAEEPLVSSNCLPGGVFVDSPREAEQPKPTRVRNKHDVFDDDDEMLMKEILDSVGDVPVSAA
mmetsp:Transcript_71550/g.220898  ORF Transcript_71550/g.220898 Transcript_71550/m.220898 type:complete len:246 (-) Transcript_71550:226-963(-)